MFPRERGGRMTPSLNTAKPAFAEASLRLLGTYGAGRHGGMPFSLGGHRPRRQLGDLLHDALNDLADRFQSVSVSAFASLSRHAPETTHGAFRGVGKDIRAQGFSFRAQSTINVIHG